MRSLPFVVAALAFVLTVSSSSAAEETAEAALPASIAGRGIELRPYYGILIVPHSLSLGLAGIDVTYRLGDHFALGLDGALYKPFDEGVGSNPGAPLSVTLTSADLDFVYFPWPGRSAPGHRAGAFEPFVLAGVGYVATRPVAVVDPVNRHFDDSILVGISPGIGARLFCTSWLAIDVEARDAIYSERQENTSKASGSTTLPLNDPNNPANPSTWYSPSEGIVNALQLRIGVSVFPAGF